MFFKLLWLITCAWVHMDPQELQSMQSCSCSSSVWPEIPFLQVLCNECLDRIIGRMTYIVWSFLFLIPLDGLSRFLEYSFLSAYAFPSRSTQLQKHLCFKSIWFCFVQCHEELGQSDVAIWLWFWPVLSSHTSLGRNSGLGAEWCYLCLDTWYCVVPFVPNNNITALILLFLG